MTWVTVKAIKTSQNDMAGVGFSRKSESSPLILARVDKGGLFGNSPLIPGLAVQKINGRDMAWVHPKDAAKEILESPRSISITAEGFVGNVWKPRKTPTGVVLKDTEDGSVFISQIRSDSIFLESDIKAGMEIISINGVPCPKPAWRATHTLQRSTGKVKVVAIRCANPDKVDWWKSTRQEQHSQHIESLTARAPPMEDEEYSPSLFERLCASMPHTQSMLGTAYDRRPSFLRGASFRSLMPGQKMVRFNSKSNTIRSYDPNGRTTKMYPLNFLNPSTVSELRV
mmetsp:Transcript_23622/g.57924  ORF Transcript_23622/g.57924 Transcript_23622/m.57924 type:complete len:284 (-) Transcript_23622:306-1157(-)|eukprot:CAMPEP_0113627908 /NCGR_PEP_ID=MMETSP0017_2-20120614/14456_1 /TAXON_ID=2856 /ORGANISM="Cylindrotheca closterium" /LENGTH=283 /DNA_ID=CAMNT_0000538185 /DNA_START=82 /DNA_END=933 /DNA_ORIENTATION=- /assembly_acc=CAM_ASM_000147